MITAIHVNAAYAAYTAVLACAEDARLAYVAACDAYAVHTANDITIVSAAVARDVARAAHARADVARIVARRNYIAALDGYAIAARVKGAA